MLYEVDIKFSVVVEAKSLQEAETIAKDNVHEMWGDYDTDYFASEIPRRKYLPSEWINYMPYGGNDNRTCKEYFQDVENDCEV